jgi:hypothetical protein
MLVGASPVPVTTTNASVLLNDVRVPLLSANSGQISFQIPAGTPPGPLAVRVEASGERSLPIAIPVEQQVSAARILAASTAAGDLVSLSVTGIALDERITVQIAGKPCRLVGVLPDGDKIVVIIQLPEDVRRGETLPVTITTPSGTTEPFNLRIGG